MIRQLVLVLAALSAACAGGRSRISLRNPAPPLVTPAAYEHYILARLAAERGDHDLALAELRMAAAAARGHIELRIAIGEQLLASGNVPAAVVEAEALGRDLPREPLAFRLLGRARAAQGDAAGAAAAFERAASLDGSDEDVWLMLGAVRRQLGDDKRATEAYRRLLKRLPASAEGHFRLGRSLASVGQLEDARVALARAVDLDPSHVDARVALAEIHRRAGRASDAAATLRTAFERSGSDARVGERLFQVLLESGDQRAAAELVRKIDADWRTAGVRLRLGLMFLQLRLHGDALRIARSMLARDGAEHAARILAARALAQAGSRAEAIALCREVPFDSYSYLEARAFAAELHGRAGTPQEGLLLLEDALAAYPDEAQLLAAAAALHEQLGAVAQARALLDAALDRAPGDDALVYARASLEDRARDPERAVAIMKRLLERDADNVTALNFIGYSWADRGVHLDDAERLLRRAIELRPDDAFVLDSLGWLHLRRGQLDRARVLLERAGRLLPYEPEILYHLGELSLKSGEPARARDLFRTALGLEPDGRIREQLEERVRTIEARAP